MEVARTGVISTLRDHHLSFHTENSLWDCLVYRAKDL